MKYLLVATVALSGLVGMTVSASAHTPLCACYDNGDGTVFCEGGYSDGSSAAGVRLAVRDADGNVLIEGSMNEESEFVFEKPDGKYSVLLDSGPGHQVEISSEDITE